MAPAPTPPVIVDGGNDDVVPIHVRTGVAVPAAVPVAGAMSAPDTADTVAVTTAGAGIDVTAPKPTTGMMGTLLTLLITRAGHDMNKHYFHLNNEPKTQMTHPSDRMAEPYASWQ